MRHLERRTEQHSQRLSVELIVSFLLDHRVEVEQHPRQEGAIALGQLFKQLLQLCLLRGYLRMRGYLLKAGHQIGGQQWLRQFSQEELQQTAGGRQVELINGGVVLPVVVQPLEVHQTRLDGLNLVDLLTLQVILQEVDAVAHNQGNVHAVVAAGSFGRQANGHPKDGIPKCQHFLRGGDVVLLLRQLLALLILFVLLVSLLVLFLALLLLVLLLGLITVLVLIPLFLFDLVGDGRLLLCVLRVFFRLIPRLFPLLLALGAGELEGL